MKSSYSNSSANCVEAETYNPGDAESPYYWAEKAFQARRLGDTTPLIVMRDSKDSAATKFLTFTRGEMIAFLNGAKAGEFDDLVALATSKEENK